MTIRSTPLLIACLFSIACREEPAPATTATAPPSSAAPIADADAPASEPAELDALIAEMKDKQRCNRVTGCAAVAKIVALGPDIIARLERELASQGRGDEYWPSMMLDALSQLSNARAVPALRGYIKDRRWELNFIALRGLGRLATNMGSTLRAEIAAEVRARGTGPIAAIDVTASAASLFALARLEPERKDEHHAALLALLPMDRASSAAMPPPTLDTVVMLVAEAKLTRGLPGIRWAALSENRFVSVHALEALGAMKDTYGVPFALARLDAENPTVRRTALAALQSITGARTITTAEDWRAWAAKHDLDKLPD